MQDIFCDEDNFNEKKYKKKSTYNKADDSLIDYLMRKHVALFGEEMRTFFSQENKQKIAAFTQKFKLPYQHFVAFVFRELPDTKIFTNVITSENWIPKFNNYVESLKVPADIYQLRSPYALPCWGEYQTFMGCLRSFVQSGKTPVDLINNFVFSERISNFTLEYIYNSLELNNPELNQHFAQFSAGKILPYEDVNHDLNLILQYYEQQSSH